MPSLSWPNAFVWAAALAAVTTLGLTHVLDATWIENAGSAALGVALGHTVGFTRGLAKGKLASPVFSETKAA